MTIRDVLDGLEQAERAFAGREFLAPLAERGLVRVRIAGVVCRLRVTGGPAEGWALLRALSAAQAEYLRPAGFTEIARYLDLFPAVRLILVRREKTWLAAPAQSGDRRIHIEGLVPLRLAEDGLEPFETIIARFDGQTFWFQRRDPARDPAIAAYLRARLAARDAKGLPPPPEQLHKRGLSREEREAYGQVRAHLEIELRDPVERRLSEALEHAGAALSSYIERDGVYTVRYQVDGREHQSILRREDLTVVSAGICLSGEDRRFDLTSLVGVLREAEQDAG